MLEQVSSSVLEDMVQGGETVVADFFATWCGPCKMMHPTVEAVSQKHENIKFFQVDVDDCFDYCEQHGISAVPTFVVFGGGKEIARKSGYLSAPVFEDFVLTAASMISDQK